MNRLAEMTWKMDKIAWKLYLWDAGENPNHYHFPNKFRWLTRFTMWLALLVSPPAKIFGGKDGLSN